jgi:hypothetical protein
LGVCTGHRLADPILSGGRQPFSIVRVIQADRSEPVPAKLHAKCALGVTLEEVAESPVGQSSASNRPPLRLLELITVLRIVEEICEVGKQVEAVAQQEARRPD